jgi:hypothetical protein
VTSRDLERFLHNLPRARPRGRNINPGSAQPDPAA